jgi:hypothetical protein
MTNRWPPRGGPGVLVGARNGPLGGQLGLDGTEPIVAAAPLRRAGRRGRPAIKGARREERDRFFRRHRASAQLWLSWLHDAGLIQVAPERDNKGYWWRTVIELRGRPLVDVDALQAARARMKGWGAGIAAGKRGHVVRAVRWRRSAARPPSLSAAHGPLWGAHARAACMSSGVAPLSRRRSPRPPCGGCSLREIWGIPAGRLLRRRRISIPSRCVFRGRRLRNRCPPPSRALFSV